MNVENKYALSDFSCPFESTLSPFVNEIHTEVKQWAKHFGLVKDELDEKMFEKERISWLCCRAFHDTPKKRLLLATKFSYWIYKLDDLFDNQQTGSNHTEISAIVESLCEILALNRLVDNEIGTPFEAALSDIWQQCIPITDETWRQCVLEDMAQTLSAGVWEAKNRQRKQIPSILEYRNNRPFTSAVFICFDFYELASGNILPLSLKRNRILQCMLFNANNYVSFTNDIYSLSKELKHNDFHNLVVVARNEKNISWQQALDHCVEIVDEELKSFIAYEKVLFKQRFLVDEKCKNMLKRYLVGVKGMMRGYIDFSIKDSFRYNNKLISDELKNNNIEA